MREPTLAIDTLQATRSPAYVVYLLHFDRPIGKARHYIGITRVDRFEKRLREHANGRGSRLTSAAIKRGVRLYLAHLWSSCDPNLERRIKRRAPAKHYCSYCRLNLTPRANSAINPTTQPAEREGATMDLQFADRAKPRSA